MFSSVCVCVCVSHVASVFYGVFADSRLFAHASLGLAFVFQLCAGVGGDWGVMTSMRMQLVSSVSSVASYVCRFSSVRGWWGIWGWVQDDVHANAACVFCFFCCVTSHTLPVAL